MTTNIHREKVIKSKTANSTHIPSVILTFSYSFSTPDERINGILHSVPEIQKRIIECREKKRQYHVFDPKNTKTLVLKYKQAINRNRIGVNYRSNDDLYNTPTHSLQSSLASLSRQSSDNSTQSSSASLQPPSSDNSSNVPATSSGIIRKRNEFGSQPIPYKKRRVAPMHYNLQTPGRRSSIDIGEHSVIMARLNQL